jgi:pyrroline-5-carboxylate reductase
MKTYHIGFIGGGNMAASLISGLISSGHTPTLLSVADVDSVTLAKLAHNFQIQTTVNNADIVAAADVIVLAVKPQVMASVARELAPLLAAKPALIISIAAGINQHSLSRWLGAECAIVRCMPNTPALVQTGATALHANAQVNTAQRNLAESIMRAVGLSLWVSNESLLDAVTATSGSGPAYFFLLMEAMESAAINLGLDAATARLLVQQTALGAAKIALESSEAPAELRQRVTSPGGTTEQAINTFQSGGFTDLVSHALQAAHARSISLSQQLEQG